MALPTKYRGKGWHGSRAWGGGTWITKNGVHILLKEGREVMRKTINRKQPKVMPTIYRKSQAAKRAAARRARKRSHW